MITGHQQELGRQLRALRDADPTAKALFDWFSTRLKGARTTKARVAAERTGCDYADIISLFRRLDELGVGRFLVGRKGQESRMEWSYDVHTLVLLSNGEIDLAEAVAEDAPEFDEEEAGNVRHRYALRPNYEIELALPADLRPREADRLANWIRTLPFEED